MRVIKNNRLLLHCRSRSHNAYKSTQGKEHLQN